MEKALAAAKAIIEADARRPVVCVARRHGLQQIPRIASVHLEDALVELDQVVDRIARRFIAQAIGERKIGADAPLVLREEKVIVVAEIRDQLAARQGRVDLRDGGLIINQPLQVRVL